LEDGWLAFMADLAVVPNLFKVFKQDFIPFHIAYAFIKTFIFALLLATIPSFHGFYMKGGALEVGKASTIAFVWTSVSDYFNELYFNSITFNLMIEVKNVEKSFGEQSIKRYFYRF
jgi:ABC-type transporter Mla maintaining outer membrane lipid asymmetry permease subunit MlaE